MFEWLTNPEAWVALFTLTALEIVLGIDNIIVISILVSRLPLKQRQPARLLGLGLAMGLRIALLLSLSWMMRLVDPLFSVLGQDISGRDLILLLGGAFLIIKSLMELIESVKGEHEEAAEESNKSANFLLILVQIGLLDIVFSLDSVITAVGISDQIGVMVIAIVIAVLIMMVAAKAIGDFVDSHPTIKNLALAFLVLIGVVLIGEGFDLHIPKAVVYTAMAFSVIVELLNIRMKKNIAKHQAKSVESK